MRYEQIINAVYFSPWSIDQAGWKAVHSIVLPHITGRQLPAIKADDGTDFWGNPMPKLDVTGEGTAIVPVKGTLIQHAGLIDKLCGACSYQDIKNDLRSVSDMGLERVMLDIASPGGMCIGNQEVCDYILELRDQGMQIDAFADTQMCSAAYNIAASCDTIYLTSTAFAGCIGVLMAVIDNSKEFAEAGLKVELFASGKYKGAGTDGLPMTDDHRAYFNSLKDKFAGMFKENVTANRPQVEAASMEGQSFIGTDALDAGIVDDIVADIDAALDV